METTITFVLGALCGLFLLGMVYAFAGVLKMQKKIKVQQHEFDHLHKQLNNLADETHRRITKNEERAHQRMDEILREVEQARQDEVRRSNDDYSNLRKVIDDTNRYVDKRVDNATTTAVQYIDKKIENTVDVLCTRMDLNHDQLIKS
jgi:hypothetical protein